MAATFISYKSESANEVRAVVECLRANGVRTWFAEYEVVAAEYDQFQERIEHEIDRAIGGCQSAVLFTNNVWARSPYCRQEIGRITAGMPVERILQVCLPREDEPAANTPLLQHVPSIDYRHGHLEPVVRFLIGHLAPQNRHLDLPDPDRALGDGPRFLTRFGPVRAGPLRYAPLPAQMSSVARSHLFRFTGVLGDQPVQLDVNVNPFNTAASPFSMTRQGIASLARLPAGAGTDDRAVYAFLRGIAKAWYAKHPHLTDSGLHLFFWNGDSHLCLTYRSHGSDGGIVWHRLYALIVDDPQTGTTGEVDFEFSVSAPPADVEQTFQRFCGLTGALDAIVRSFEYRGDLVHVSPPSRALTWDSARWVRPQARGWGFCCCGGPRASCLARWRGPGLGAGRSATG